MFGLVPFSKNNNLADNSAFSDLLNVFNEPFFNNLFAPVQQVMKTFKVDVKDLGDSYELTAELPGVKKEDISLNYDSGYLTIKTVESRVSDEKNPDGGSEQSGNHQYLRRERYFGSKERSFYIDDVDTANIKAEYKDGVLKVDLPKAVKKEESTKINIA